ncbi:MAG: NAD-dependent epimerase/dehydratase family protein [Sphingobacteriaceae bacterium]|nr:NAD-dependent epimerase/dehydratase family protein [Sphingobacteriaceae bacterium]
MNVAVIGANGFIGKHLVAKLSSLPNVNVFAFDISDKSAFDSKITYKKNDLSDSKQIASDFADIDIVYFLASATIPVTSWENPIMEMEKNLIPFINFGNIVAQLKVKKIAFLSSAGTIYGSTKQKVSETSDKNPFSPYGITKLAMENFLLYFKTRYNISYDVYRISNVYGEGQNTSKGLGLINTLLEKIISENKIKIFGNGETLRNYIYVKDVAELLSLSTTADVGTSSTYNISSNDSLTINQIVDVIKTTVSEKFEIINEDTRLSDNSAIDLDNTKIIKAVPSFKFTPIAKGIAQTYSYIKANS